MLRLAVPLVLLLATLLLPSAALAEPVQPRVVGGTTVAPGDHPWQVALLRHDETDTYQGQFCGGTLISASRVLTAAHCTEGETPASIDVLAGTTRLDGSGERIPVLGIRDHPQAGDEPVAYRYDVSVLELDRPVTGARPLGVVGTSEADLWAAADTLTVTGWGRIRQNLDAQPADDPTAPGDYPRDLQEAPVVRRSDASCGGSYGADFKAADMLCAGFSGTAKDTCQGDSGGPILAPVTATPNRTQPADWRLVGATSWGRGCADPGYPGVYARLDAPAIRSFVAAQLSGAPYLRSAPTLTGTPQAGKALTCSTGAWGNDPTTYGYAFERIAADGAVALVASGAGHTYAVTDADGGVKLRCTVTASSPNGEASASSAAVGPVPAASPPGPAPTPVPSPGPTPTPTPTPPPVDPTDRAAPRITAVSRRCTQTRCTLTIRTSDAAPSAGLFRVAASVRARVQGRTRSRTLSSRRKSSRTFTVSVPRLGRGTYRLTLRAVDRAGNRQRVATIRSFKLFR